MERYFVCKQQFISVVADMNIDRWALDFVRLGRSYSGSRIHCLKRGILNGCLNGLKVSFNLFASLFVVHSERGCIRFIFHHSTVDV